jgi:AraC-like DNA-binding protein
MVRRSSVNSHLFYDPSLRKLSRLLEQEGKDGGETGSEYAHHLAKAGESRTQALMQFEESTFVSRRCIAPADRVKGIIQMIDADMLVRTDLASLAGLSGYSKSHFARVFRCLTGSSPHQYILRHRLEVAMRRIRDSGQSLTEIAFLCGFASDTHLAHAFSKHFGVSPRSIRVGSKANLKGLDLLNTGTECPSIQQ